MRNTNNSHRFLDDVAYHWSLRTDTDASDWHDQEEFNRLIRDPNYARFLDLHPKHPQSYLHKDKKKEPLMLIKFLPQMPFINGHALMKYPPENGAVEYYMVHTNGWGKDKEAKLRDLNAWKLDDYNQCVK